MSTNILVGNGGGGGGGGGSAATGALVKETGENDRGLFVSTPDANPSWHLRGVERQLAEEAVPAEAEWPNQDRDATVKLLAPVDWIAPPETVNDRPIRYTRYTPPRDAIPATYAIGDVDVSSQQVGLQGNNDFATIVRGSGAVTKANAHAVVVGRRGTEDVPLPGGDILVRAPNFGSGQTATVQLLRSGTVYLKVDWHESGAGGNGFQINIEYESTVTTGQAAPGTVTDDQGTVIGITVGVNGITTIAAIANALNGVSVGGTQLVTASAEGGGGSRNIDGTNDVNAVLANGSDHGFAAKGTIAGSVVVTYHKVGAEGNGFEVLIDRSAGNASGVVTVQYLRRDTDNITASLQPLSNLAGIRLVVNGSVTRAALAAALNSVFTSGVQVVSATAGTGLISYNNSAADEDLELAGGTSGTGAGTNGVGAVTVARADGADAVSAKAKVTVIDISNSNAEIEGGITITHPNPGTAGNAWNVRFATGTIGTYAQVNLRNADSSTSGIIVRATTRGTDGNSLVVSVQGSNTQASGTIHVAQSGTNLGVIGHSSESTTLGAVIDAINNASSNTSFLAYLAGGSSRSDTFTFKGNAQQNTERLSGGNNTTRSGNVTALWSISLQRLTVRHFVPSVDTVQQVVNTITGLSQFQTGDGTNPGDVVVASSVAASTDRPKGNPSSGANQDYPFSGGLAPGRRAGVRPSFTANYFAPTGTSAVLEVYAKDTYADFTQNFFVDYAGGISLGTAQVSTGGTGTTVSIRGTVTLNAIIAAFNSEQHVAGQSLRARLPQGADGTATVTWASTNTRRGSGGGARFSGGMAPTDTLSASYTAATNTLVLTAHPTDTIDGMMNAIALLPEFQRARGGQPVDGSMPGDLWISDDATTLDTLVVPATISAAALSYPWMGGRDQADRSPLSVVGAVDSAPAAATGGDFAGVGFTYHQTGTGGNGARIRYQLKYDPDLEAGRASAGLTFQGKQVRFRWHNTDAYGNGVSVRIRRHSPFGSQFDTGNKQYTLNLPDGTYTFRQLQNNFARAFHPLPPIERVLGPVRMEVAAADLDTEFTVNAAFVDTGTGNFAGAGSGGSQVDAEYTALGRELVVTETQNVRGALTGVPFSPNSALAAAVNGARYEGLQLITATVNNSALAGPITMLPADAAAGDTVAIGSPTVLSGGTEGASLITISGLLATDTENEMRLAFTGTPGLFRFGTSNTPVGNFTPVVRGSFSGGRDELGRQSPGVVLQDDGDIAVFLILQSNNPVNTTLKELAEAMWAATYTNTDGETVPVPFENVVIDTSGGGSVDDPLRNQGRPRTATGGENYVPESPIEALVRPNDEVQGPNVEVRYHADVDTLQEILDALLAQGEVDVVEVYGTDLTAVPEEPPFVRSMYPGGGDTTINVTGGSNVDIQDEGASLGAAQELNFVGDGVTAAGTGTTKTITIPGLDQERFASQTHDEIEADVKPWAIVDGPQVPDTEIPDVIARDSEAATNLLARLTTGTLGGGQNDEVPFFTSTGTPHKTTTQQLRALMKGYVGPWEDTAGFFVFRQGDLTDHNGNLYWVNAVTSTKDSSNGPETNADFTLLTPFSGTWSTGWYKAGAIVRYLGGLYLADVDIVNTDGTPEAETKWTRIDGNVDSLVGVSVTDSTLRATTRGGTHHDVTLPTGGTTIAANPAGSDGDILRRLAIGGTNWILDAEVPVNRGLILGRVTSTAGKYPTDLTDHTNPIRVPIPTWGDLTDGESPGGDAAAWKAKSRDWPVIPLVTLPDNGGFLANLDTTENSVQIQEGLYIIGTRAQNVWANDIESGDTWTTGAGSGVGSTRLSGIGRLIIEILIEYWDAGNSEWVELSKTFGPYTRRAPVARQTQTSSATGTTTGDPGSDDANDGTGSPDYDGRLSPVTATMFSVISIPPGGLTIRFRLERGDSMAPAFGAGTTAMAYDDEGFPLHPNSTNVIGNQDGGTVPWGFFADIPAISFYPLGQPTQTTPLVPRPHINSFTLTSGDQDVPAGDISSDVYGYAYTIAQGSHAGAGRIIGFKGDTKPSGSATVLATLTNLNHGSGTVTIPSTTSLAADEEYRLRLQVFAEGVTPTADTVPVSYQDIVISAHAAATAPYHVGYVAYDSNDADAAATAARITDFTNDTATALGLPSTITVALPDSSDYQIYLLAKSDEAQPTGFTSAGQNASNSFYAAQDVTISSVTYKAYILKPLFRLTSANNGQTFGVTS